MSQILTPAAARTAPAASGYRVDPFRGERVSRVSSEWFSRPADQRFLSLADLHRLTGDLELPAAAGSIILRYIGGVACRGEAGFTHSHRRRQ